MTTLQKNVRRSMKKKPSVQQYFDLHTHDLSYTADPESYKPLIEFIREYQQKVARPITILDVGCGTGIFIQKVLESGISIASIVGVDISQGMVKAAKDRLAKFQNVRLEVASGFEISKTLNSTRFDVIFISFVLHHLIARTQGGSKKLAIRMIKELLEMCSGTGIIIVEELHYKSAISPKITSKLIFYGLKLVNALHIDARRFMQDVQPGLEVNFFHQEELVKMLSAFGQVSIVHYIKLETSKVLRYFLLKEYGMVILCLVPNKVG
jgi:2-polyprenyl-3-methyl-5-hydroxy-6-metoxy-1,4-benzoquinol methylase